MAISPLATVYSDQLISATELNRQPGRVLDLAWERAITITRKEQHFALLPREDMAGLVKAATQTQVAFKLINVAYQLRLGEAISPENSYQWLKAFDNEELAELITEIINAFKLGSETGVWDTLEVVIHEWHESATAIQSSELFAAFNDELDEVLLTQPTSENITQQAYL